MADKQKQERSLFARELAYRLSQAQQGQTLNVEGIERTLRQIIADEAPETEAAPDWKTIERDRVVDAVALLGFDTASVIEVVLTPTHVTASLLEPARPGKIQRQMMSHTMRILPSRLPQTPPTILTGDPAADARDEAFS